MSNWIQSVDFTNWCDVKSNKAWGTVDWNKTSKTKKGDKIIFYVNTTNNFCGIFEVVSDWFESIIDWSDGEQSQYRIDLKPIQLGYGDFFGTMLSKLDFPKGKTGKALNFVLRNHPSVYANSGKSISDKDYKIILDELKNNQVLPARYIKAEERNNRQKDKSENNVEQNFWLVGSGRENERQEMWREFENNNIVGVGWNNTGDVSNLSNKEIEKKFKENGDKGASSLIEFKKIKPNDIVFVNDGKQGFFGIGKVIGPYRFDTQYSLNHHVIPVEWITTEYILVKPDNVPGNPNAGVSRIVKDKKSLLKYLNGMTDVANKSTEMTEKLLVAKNQIIFSGPPGTGKTFSASKFAEKFISNNLREKYGDEPDSDDKNDWFEYLKNKLEETLPKEYKISNPNDGKDKEYFVLKSDHDEKRIRIFYGNKEKSSDSVEVGFKEKSTNWISQVPEDSRFFIIINLSNRSFVVLPFKIVKKYAQFRGGIHWDDSGKDTMWFTMPVLTEKKATLRANNSSDAKQFDCSRFLFNLEEILISDLEYITFHPSFSYEEFMEGIRAKTVDGSIEYNIEDGIFKQICKVAKKDHNKNCKYLLIIDEINRGNIAKIFGELITIIEKNKREQISVVLPYSKERFSVPKNVYIIGTMNTADRSLVQIDIALRRRFGFVEFMPNKEILRDSPLDLALPNLMTRLNELILERSKNNRELQIGHSYFMIDGKPISNVLDLQFTFETEIIPLLQEYFYQDYNELVKVLGTECVDVNRQEIKNLSKEQFKSTMNFILQKGKKNDPAI